MVCLVRGHLRRYCATESAETSKSVLSALKKFPERQEDRREPLYDRDLASVLIFPERRRGILLEGIEKLVGDLKARFPEEGRESPAPHRATPQGAFDGFTSTAAPTFLTMRI